jgi:hypothetical protein
LHFAFSHVVVATMVHHIRRVSTAHRTVA